MARKAEPRQLRAVSGDQILKQMTVHIGEPAVGAVVAHGERGVIDAQLMKHRGVHILHLNSLAVGRL